MAEERKVQRKKIIKKLKNKYRLVLMNDTTFEERFSLLLTPLNVILLFWVSFLLIAMIVLGVVVLTPLKQYIPGYPDDEIRENALLAARKADSLQRELSTKQLYLDNLSRLLKGEEGESPDTASSEQDQKNVDLEFSRSKEDSLLREQMESDVKYNLSIGQSNVGSGDFRNLLFFSPIRGTITAKMDRLNNHFGIDVVAAKDEPIKAALDGVVILSSWTLDGGYVLQIQHENNWVSVYKHNSVLLKKAGDRVKAGDSVAIIGDSGELTDGPHLHFELWHNGEPVDPERYIVFN